MLQSDVIDRGMLQIMDALKPQLIQNVQHNCVISDARYARDYSMCVYLLRMQEHYRWKNAIPLNCAVKGETLGDWVRETEDYSSVLNVCRDYLCI